MASVSWELLHVHGQRHPLYVTQTCCLHPHGYLKRSPLACSHIARTSPAHGKSPALELMPTHKTTHDNTYDHTAQLFCDQPTPQHIHAHTSRQHMTNNNFMPAHDHTRRVSVCVLRVVCCVSRVRVMSILCCVMRVVGCLGIECKKLCCRLRCVCCCVCCVCSVFFVACCVLCVWCVLCCMLLCCVSQCVLCGVYYELCVVCCVCCVVCCVCVLCVACVLGAVPALAPVPAPWLSPSLIFPNGV